MTAPTCDPCRLALGLTPHHDPGRNRFEFKTLTAIHEAAHAVCALHLGCEVVSLSIKPETLLFGRRRYSGVCHYVPSRSRTDKRIAGVAGVVGEAVFIGWNDASEIQIGDFNSTDARDLHPDNIAHAISRARQILTDNWHLACTLAEGLEHEGELPGYLVTGLIQVEQAGQWLREQKRKGPKQ